MFRALAGTLLTVLILACVAHADTITIKDEVYVRGPKVLLSDVADFEGLQAEALGAIELGTAPMPGGSKQLNASLIESRIRAAGYDNEEVEVTGSRQVRAHMLSLEVSRAQLAESLRAHILASIPWDPADTRIEVPMPMADVVVPDGDLEVVWDVSPAYRYIGPGAFRATILVDGQVEKSLSMRANVETFADVVVAKRDIPRGRPVSPGDVELRKESLSRQKAGAVTRLEDAVGLVSKRTLFPGQVLSQRDIEYPVAVKRNQFVSVELRTGGLKLSTRAQAKHDARVGDLVTCVNQNSDEQFQGIVQNDGTVLVE